MRKIINTQITLWLLFAFFTNTISLMPLAEAQEFHLPALGVRVGLSPKFAPPILKGIKVHPDNPFRFDFILDQGGPQVRQEATKLIKYFLASLTIPEKDLWVNLSPYEKDRIIPQSFGLTEMGRDLLAEDYMLKQITASLIYPEGATGKKFWKRIYEEAEKKFGTTNIPVNTFNKVWIIPEKAVVYENAKAGTAYVVRSTLKVMLEQDYLAISHNVIPSKAGIHNKNDINALGSQIVREVVIPELTKEVNENKNFSQLRQVYNSLILATWYKKKIKDSILAQIYEDKNKIQGLVIPAKAGIQNKNNVEFIYQRYLQAFKKGVYNYIKEEQDPGTQEVIPRKYFSGGFDFNQAMLTYAPSVPDSALLSKETEVDITLIPEGRFDLSRRGVLRASAGSLALRMFSGFDALASEHPPNEVVVFGYASPSSANIRDLRSWLNVDNPNILNTDLYSPTKRARMASSIKEFCEKFKDDFKGYHARLNEAEKILEANKDIKTLSLDGFIKPRNPIPLQDRIKAVKDSINIIFEGDPAKDEILDNMLLTLLNPNEYLGLHNGRIAKLNVIQIEDDKLLLEQDRIDQELWKNLKLFNGSLTQEDFKFIFRMYASLDETPEEKNNFEDLTTRMNNQTELKQHLMDFRENLRTFRDLSHHRLETMADRAGKYGKSILIFVLEPLVKKIGSRLEVVNESLHPSKKIKITINSLLDNRTNRAMLSTKAWLVGLILSAAIALGPAVKPVLAQNNPSAQVLSAQSPNSVEYLRHSNPDRDAFMKKYGEFVNSIYELRNKVNVKDVSNEKKTAIEIKNKEEEFTIYVNGYIRGLLSEKQIEVQRENRKKIRNRILIEQQQAIVERRKPSISVGIVYSQAEIERLMVTINGIIETFSVCHIKFENEDDPENLILHLFGPEFNLAWKGELEWNVKKKNEKPKLIGLNDLLIMGKVTNLFKSFTDSYGSLKSDKIHSLGINWDEFKKDFFKIEKMIDTDPEFSYPSEEDVQNTLGKYDVDPVKLQNTVQAYIDFSKVRHTDQVEFIFNKIKGVKGIIILYLDSEITDRLKPMLKTIGRPFKELDEKMSAVYNHSHPENGGIDLTPLNVTAQTQNMDGEINFHIDPAMLQELQKAPGFRPDIIKIQPMNDVKAFLGIND